MKYIFPLPLLLLAVSSCKSSGDYQSNRNPEFKKYQMTCERVDPSNIQSYVWICKNETDICYITGSSVIACRAVNVILDKNR
jgi:hypothetical protein